MWVMAWCLTGDKPIPEPMFTKIMASLGFNELNVFFYTFHVDHFISSSIYFLIFVLFFIVCTDSRCPQLVVSCFVLSCLILCILSYHAQIIWDSTLAQILSQNLSCFIYALNILHTLTYWHLTVVEVILAVYFTHSFYTH